MAVAFPQLLSPLVLRRKRLPTRIVFTAHTASFGQDGLPGERARAYYEARAAGGAGLIVMEPLPVLPNAGVTPQNYRWDDERFVPALRRLVDAVHAHGTVFVSQLYHLGPNSDPIAGASERWAPSPGPAPGGPDGLRAMDDRDLADLVQGHVRAATAAIEAGVDGVECMFAYDTLVDQFLAERRNHRSDRYGGDLAGRARLAVEILHAVRAAIGPEPLLGITVTAAMDGYVEAVEHLAARCDIDYVGVGHGNYELRHLLVPPMEIEPGHGVKFAARVKRAVPGLAVLAEGRINRPQIGEQALVDGACDLVGMTRALIADPQLPEKARQGEAERIRECIAYNLCIHRRLRKFPIACVQNPAAGQESAYPALESAAVARRVLVIGAGVAGLEAARVAAERGHAVTILERGAQPGGQVRDLARLPLQGPFAELIAWRVSELARLGVTIELGSECDADAARAHTPDAVIVAAGSLPSALAGSVPAVDVVRGRAVAGPVVVLDFEGHRKAAGTAEMLALAGHATTLVALNGPALGGLAYAAIAPLSLARLRDAGVGLIEGHRLVAIHDDAVELARIYDDTPLVLEAATVVHASPNVIDDTLVAALGSRLGAVHAIGDARAPRLVEDAIRDGYTVAAAV